MNYFSCHHITMATSTKLSEADIFQACLGLNVLDAYLRGHNVFICLFVTSSFWVKKLGFSKSPRTSYGFLRWFVDVTLLSEFVGVGK